MRIAKLVQTNNNRLIVFALLHFLLLLNTDKKQQLPDINRLSLWQIITAADADAVPRTHCVDNQLPSIGRHNWPEMSN